MENSTATIDTQCRTKLSPLIFGQFIEYIENCIDGGIHDGSKDAVVRLDVLEKVKELKPTILRYPGGTMIGIFDWKEFIGPKSERGMVKNYIWGSMINAKFGIPEFIDYCREIGCEPMFCVNMASGTPKEAAEWVEYCNGTDDTHYANLRRSHGYEEPFNVKYWCIGNECEAVPDLGAQHDINRYISDGWEFTKYMKLVDHSIKLVFCGCSKEAWNKAVLDSFQNVCDYFSIHHYSGTSDKNEYQAFYGLSRFNGFLDSIEVLIDSYPVEPQGFNAWYRFPPRAEKIALCLDEWNIWNNIPSESAGKYGLKCSYDWGAALWVACFLNMLIRRANSIRIANMAQMVNVIAPIVASPEGVFCQTTFYPLKYYRELAGQYSIPVDIKCKDLTGETIAAVDISATVSDNGELTVFVVNLSKEEQTCHFEGIGGYTISRRLVLSAKAMSCSNSLASQDNVSAEWTDISSSDEFVLAPMSVSVFIAT